MTASSSPPPSRLRRLVRVAWQTVAIGVITFALAEVTVRAVRYFAPTAFPSLIFYDQSYNRYRGQPGARDYDFHLNAAGFKDQEFSREKPPGTFRIVAPGDSFAFGVVPYQLNYLTLLEDHLNAAGHRTEIINMGIPGLGPQDYLSVLANEGLPLQPDMVLLSFFIGNDFDETRRLRTKLYEMSDVLALIKYVVDTHTKIDGQVYHNKDYYDDNAPFFSRPTYLRVLQERGWIYLKVRPYEQAMGAAVQYLVRIKALCDERRIPLVVVVIPDEIQVDPALQATVLSGLGVTADQADFASPNRFLGEQLRVNGIESVDLLEAFVAGSKQQRLYKPLDSHWNIAGNRLAAEQLESYFAGRRTEDTSRP